MAERNDMSSLEAFAAGKLSALEKASRRRVLRPVMREDGAFLRREGRRLLSFSDNDYLGLARDPRLAEAAAAAAWEEGMGAGASRLVTGDHPLAGEVESRIARMKGMAAARLFGSGYLANIGVIPALAGKGDLIVMDALCHACMHAGARLSGAAVRLFPHNDAGEAARLLAAAPSGARKLLLAETVYSMDGDRAPLAALHEAALERGAWLMTDDAHGFGLPQAERNPAPLQMGTLSKAAGSYGGYIAGPEAVMELLISRARSFVYTTGLPPTVLAASRAALDVMEKEPWRGKRAAANAALFCRLMDLPRPESAIVPIIIGDDEEALRLAEALEEEGFLLAAIRPPTVPEGTARLRATFSAAHERDDVERLAQTLLRLRRRAA